MFSRKNRTGMVLALATALFLNAGLTSESWADVIASGDDCAADDGSSSCHWEIISGTDEDGNPTQTLKITGSGAMKENFGNTKREDNSKVDSGATTNASWGDYHSTITGIEIGEGITDTGARSFQGLASVKSVSIPTSLTTIGAFAFDRQPDLVNFNVPEGSNLTNFSGYGAFQFSSSLTNESAQKVLDTMAANNKNNETMFDIPINTFNKSNLTSITIPEGVNEIGTQAFWGQKITSIDIPEGVTSIGDFAFSTATLESITLPSTLQSIGQAAFHSNNLTSINLPEGMTSIGVNAFINNNLTSIDIPSGVTTIEAGAFWLNSLTSVDIPEGVTTIGQSAFNAQKGIIDENGKWVSPLASISLPGTLTEIGDYAFHSHGLTELVIPDSVTNIGMYAFNGLASTDVCDRTIYDCYSDTLKTIYIPDSVTSIGEGAFKSNRALTEIVLDGDVDTSGWSQEAFMDMPAGLTFRCIGDVTKCETALERFRAPNCEGTWTCLVNAQIAPVTEKQCNTMASYYFNGSSCGKRPTDGEEITCDYENSGYIKVGNSCASPETTYAKKQYTPAEANQWLKDDDNAVTITFKK